MYFKNEKLYHALKYIAQVVLPALATFTISVGDVWDIPYSHQIGETIVALDAFMGIVLHISKMNYYEDSGIDGGDYNV